MKAILTVALMCLLSVPAMAQRGYYGGGAGYRGGYGFVGGGARFGPGATPIYGGGTGWWGGSWGPAWGYGYPGSAYGPGPDMTLVYPPTAAPTTIYITPPGPPVIEGYPPDRFMPAAPIYPAPPIYLIALRNGQVFAAVSLNVAADTLQFTTIQGENKKTPLNTVDCGLTERLNYERSIPIQLPH